MFLITNKKTRNILRVLLPCVIIPLIVVAGAFISGGRRYAYISLLLTIASLIFFITGFERRRTGSRRLVIVAVMAALCVIGRFIPIVKPITALTIMCGVYFGGEAGFLTGALAAVISNFYFGQGPWTPFQMLAWGLIGLIAGAMSKPLKKSKTLLVAYGALSGAVFSLIMDVWSVLWYADGFSWGVYEAAIISALPYTLLYAVSNGVFLLLLADSMGGKMQRISVIYDC